MGETTIEWTHNEFGSGYTLNPWRGCEHEHTGCAHCYAEKLSKWLDGNPWGPVWRGGRRILLGPGGMAEPLKWARSAAAAGERRRVFCASRADVLEHIAPPERWPLEWDGEKVVQAWEHVVHTREAVDRRRGELWELAQATAIVCARCGPASGEGRGEFGAVHACGAPMGGLDYLFLTKRPRHWREVPLWLRSLVWLGASASDQPTLDEYGGQLLEAEDFRVLFLSLEPLVGPVSLRRLLQRHPGKLGWVIIGGESGGGARAFFLEWALELIAECRAAGVPVFLKQVGDHPMRRTSSPEWVVTAPKGGEPLEWPEAARVREQPQLREAA